MPRIRNHSAEDTNLLRIIKEKADQYGEAVIKKGDIMLEYGLSYGGITNSMERLREKGYITFERVNLGKDGGGFNITIIDQNKIEEPEEDVKMRMCRKCGTYALNAEARFCWKCGATLMTDYELLNERLNALMPKVARELVTPDLANDLFEVIAELRKLVEAKND